MAAMEAVLAARRTVAVAAPPEALELEAFGTLAPMEGLGAGGRLGVSSSGPAAGNGYEILLQGFNWESHKGGQYYKRMLDAVEGLAEAGVTTVWLPPPSDAVSPQGYLPRDLYRLDSAYGSEGELRELIAALKRRGVKAVADVVINHRCAHSQDSAGRWNVFGGRLPWDASAVCCNNPAFGGTGAHKTGEDYAAAPNVDHTQPRVRQDLVRWLTWMRQSIGFDGWRFDFVKVQRVKRGEAGACGRGGGGAAGRGTPRRLPRRGTRDNPTCSLSPPPLPAGLRGRLCAGIRRRDCACAGRGRILGHVRLHRRRAGLQPGEERVTRFGWRRAGVGARGVECLHALGCALPPLCPLPLLHSLCRTRTGSAPSTGVTAQGARRRPSTSPRRASSKKPWRGASCGASSTCVAARPAWWGSGPPERCCSWKTTTPGLPWGTGPSPTTTCPPGEKGERGRGWVRRWSGVRLQTCRTPPIHTYPPHSTFGSATRTC